MKKDRTAKYDLYEQNGVETYFIVDPNSKQVDVFCLVDGSYQKTSGSDELSITLHDQPLLVSKNEIFD